VDFELSKDHQLLRQTVRDFAEERVAPVAEELDREHRFPYEIVEALAGLGLMGIPIPKSTEAVAATRSPMPSPSRS
jgi:alkylation response protein AidB-like acyl-CoA dehydrogenase